MAKTVKMTKDEAGWIAYALGIDEDEATRKIAQARSLVFVGK